MQEIYLCLESNKKAKFTFQRKKTYLANRSVKSDENDSLIKIHL